MKPYIHSLLLLGCTVMGQISLHALPAQVIVIRHAEKDPITRGLTHQGEERAAALSYYLSQTDYLLHFGLPAAIFASRSVPISDRIVPRTIETMMPLAEFLQLPIHSPFNGYQVNEIANFILNEPKYNGKNIVICWNHSSIHNLLNAFGYQAPFQCSNPQKKYPDCRFDLVFVMTFPAPPPPSGIPLPFDPNLPFPALYFQQLMFGDLTCPAAGNVLCPFGNCPGSSPPNYPPNLPPSPCNCAFNGIPSCASIVCTPPCNVVGQGS